VVLLFLLSFLFILFFNQLLVECHYVSCLHKFYTICFQEGAAALSDEEVIQLVSAKYIPTYQIEKAVNDPERGVGIRRQIVGKAGSFIKALENLPYKNYDYSKVS
jgi:hypothetical protein